MGARVLTGRGPGRVLEESHVAPWREVSPQPRPGPPEGGLDLGVPRTGSNWDGLHFRKFLARHSDTPLCLQVIGILWNELFSKDCFFLKRDKILANYQSCTATMRPQLFMPRVGTPNLKSVFCSSFIHTRDLGSAPGGPLTKVLKDIPVFTGTPFSRGPAGVPGGSSPSVSALWPRTHRVGPGWGITSGSHPCAISHGPASLRQIPVEEGGPTSTRWHLSVCPSGPQ